MDIVPYTATMIEEVTELYNGVTKNVPHCYPVAADQFASVLVEDGETDGGHARMRGERIFVAREREGLRGFVHVGVETGREKHREDRGVILFLAYERGARAAGQLLLDTAEAHFASQGVRCTVAYPQAHRYPFYHFQHAYLSEHMDHVQALLLFNGYRPCAGEIFLDWPDFRPPPPGRFDGVVRVTTEDVQGGNRPKVVLTALAGEEEVAACIHIPGGEFSRNPAADDWAFCIWLGVAESLQGRGVGKYLLLRSLDELKNFGYSHAAISTAWDNYRAYLFYSNCGYRAVDRTYGYARESAACR